MVLAWANIFIFTARKYQATKFVALLGPDIFFLTTWKSDNLFFNKWKPDNFFRKFTKPPPPGYQMGRPLDDFWSSYHRYVITWDCVIVLRIISIKYGSSPVMPKKINYKTVDCSITVPSSICNYYQPQHSITSCICTYSVSLFIMFSNITAREQTYNNLKDDLRELWRDSLIYPIHILNGCHGVNCKLTLTITPSIIHKNNNVFIDIASNICF